jgi:hypothetical protein
MKLKIYGLLIGFLVFTITSYAQDNPDSEAIPQQDEVKKKDKPVRSPWNSGILMGGKTSVVPGKGTLRFDLAHQFGPLNNGLSDIFGIYADGANIRMGLSYVFLKNLVVGVGVSKFNITTDLSAKYTLLEQTRENSIPVSLTVYGVMGIDGSNSESFGTDYVFIDRLSYFSQLIVGRKFGKYISLQASGSFTHFNSMPDGINHDVIGVGVGAKVRLSSTLSIISNNDFPLALDNISEYKNFEAAKPTFQVGVEIITTSHAFQIFLGNTNYILPQNVYARNQNNFDADGIRFGFIMTKL